MIGVCSNTSV